MGCYFGTDGIRDVAGQGQLAPAQVVRIGRAIGATLSQTSTGPQNGERFSVLVGRDTRESGEGIAALLAAGLAEHGVELRDLGVIPTPGVAYLTRLLGADLGVVISASHNPARDNGIKLFDAAGEKASQSLEDAIEQAIEALELTEPPTSLPALAPAAELAAEYEAFLVKTAGGEGALAGMRIVLDCAHGAGCHIGPRVFARLGAEVVECLGTQPNGRNINDGVGALVPQSLAPHLQRHGADIGFSLDGDADRLIALDDTGSVRDGDYILAIWGRHLHETGRLPGATVVSTIMANLGLERSLGEIGVTLERTPVGDKHVSARMREGAFVLGGEQSGHICYFADKPIPATTGDGLLTAVHLARIVRDAQQPLSKLASVLTKAPQVLINVPVRETPPLESLPPVQTAIQELEAQQNGRARLVLRYSGTESKARVMLEGDNQSEIESHAQAIAQAIRTTIGQ